MDRAKRRKIDRLIRDLRRAGMGKAIETLSVADNGMMVQVDTTKLHTPLTLRERLCAALGWFHE